MRYGAFRDSRVAWKVALVISLSTFNATGALLAEQEAVVPPLAKVEVPIRGEGVEGLRMRLTAPAGTEYRRGIKLPLLVELQNVTDKPFPFRRLGFHTYVEGRDLEGKLYFKSTVQILPWHDCDEGLAPGAVIGWTEWLNRMRFWFRAPVGKDLDLRVTLHVMPERPPARGDFTPPPEVRSNWITLRVEDTLPAPLRAEDMPETWNENMDLVYSEHGGIYGYWAMQVRADGRVACAGRECAWNSSLPKGRVETSLDKEDLDILLSFLRDQKIWELATVGPDSSGIDDLTISLSFSSAGGSLVREFPMSTWTEHPGLVGLRREMARVRTLALANAGVLPDATETSSGVAVRLRSEKFLWKPGELPLLKAAVRNTGEQVLKLGGTPIQVELDGERYTRSPENGVQLRIPVLVAETQEDITIRLGEEWCTLGGEANREIFLSRGKHMVRVRFLVWASGKPPTMVFSNFVTIVVE